MMDNLIQKLEEKVMSLVVELDDLRKEMSRVKQENVFLRSEKEEQKQKLQSLISLLDTVDTVPASPALMPAYGELAAV